MDDQPQDQAQNEVAVEDNSVAAPPADEPTTSEPNQETEGAAEEAQVDEPAAEANKEEDSERKPSRAERRIRDLVDENKRLREQPNQQFAGLQQPPMPMVEPGAELTADQYQQHVVQAADAIASLRSQQQISQLKAEMNLDRDAEVLPKEFPELDPDSPAYIPELIETIEQEFKERAFRNGQLDPDVRLATIAGRMVKAARAAAKKSTAEIKNSVAKTADTAAIKPSGEPRQEKPASEMSLSELEQKLPIVRE